MTTGPISRWPAEEDRPDRAVIDIGSNTVRLVVYSGSLRAPEVWLNERVKAKLGRDLASTGSIPDKAINLALPALARFATILQDLGIENAQTVATAAVRDSANGAEFLESVRALGLEPRLMSGEEEAFASAFGVIGAFPGALGTVADLGGGSLELVMVEQGDCGDGISLPLGTLRLPALRERGDAKFRQVLEKEIARAGWASAHPGPLYMVGGTWRALAIFAMRQSDNPLTDPHGFALETAEADRIAKSVARMTADELSSIRGISSSRAANLPDAASMLRVMLEELRPDGVVFSSWGLREGLLFQRLGPGTRRQDPLIAAVARFAGPRGGSARLASLIAAWTRDIVDGAGTENERLRLAATMLALAAARVEPNHRARHAYEWALDKRWVGLDPPGRAKIAAALLAACGKVAPSPDLERLVSRETLREAIGWGLAIRLCQKLGAGSEASLPGSDLGRERDKLVLRLDPDRAHMASSAVMSELKTLAEWLGSEPGFRIAERDPS